MKKLHFLLADYALFLAFAIYAAGSVIVPVLLPEIAADFGFPLDDGGKGAAGTLHMMRSCSMLAAMLLSGFTAAKLGVRRNLIPALGIMALALGGIIFASGYWMLVVLIMCAGVGEGTLEALATPAVEKLHRNEDAGRYLNFSHSFWSFGVVMATIGGGLMLRYQVNWRYPIALAALFSLLPLLLLLPRPVNQRVLDEIEKDSSSAGVWQRVGEILRTGRFWWFFAAIFLAGGVEWCFTYWVASYVRLAWGASPLQGGFAAAIFALGMFFGRMCAGVLVPQRKLPGLLVWCGLLTAVLGALIFAAQSLWIILLLVGLVGVVIGPLWPTIQNVCVAKVGLDSTLIYILLSCSGIPGCGIFTCVQGMLADIPQIGFTGSFLMAPLFAAVMTGVLIMAVREKTHLKSTVR